MKELERSERFRFLTSHWDDLTGWKEVPFWCVVVAEGLYAARPWWFQLAVLAAGGFLSWVWGRALLPLVSARVGTVHRPQPFPQPAGKRWPLVLSLYAVWWLITWLLSSVLSGFARGQPAGWMEGNCTMAACALAIIGILQAVDPTNPPRRRGWYAGNLLVCTVFCAAAGCGPFTFARAFAFLGVAQCVVAAADLLLLMELAGPTVDQSATEMPHGEI